MPTEIVLNCCEGKPLHAKLCLGSLCPHYRQANSELDRETPWMPTGFGNAYPAPSKLEILLRVQKNLKVE